MKQKSREIWMHQEDRNTQFFYSVVKAKQSRNHISHLINDEGEAATDIGSIKAEAHAFFLSSINLATGMYFQN